MLSSAKKRKQQEETTEENPLYQLFDLIACCKSISSLQEMKTEVNEEVERRIESLKTQRMLSRVKKNGTIEISDQRLDLDDYPGLCRIKVCVPVRYKRYGCKGYSRPEFVQVNEVPWLKLLQVDLSKVNWKNVKWKEAGDWQFGDYDDPVEIPALCEAFLYARQVDPLTCDPSQLPFVVGVFNEDCCYYDDECDKEDEDGSTVFFHSSSHRMRKYTGAKGIYEIDVDPFTEERFWRAAYAEDVTDWVADSRQKSDFNIHWFVLKN
jgi:hypothetical protein